MTLLQKVKTRIHGVISLFTFGICTLIGFIQIYLYNLIAALIYVAIIFIGAVTICYFYCLKCPCRIYDCGHIFPGKITKLFKPKAYKGYAFIDYFMVILSLVAILGYPQFWLFKTFWPLLIFWFLTMIAFIEVKLFVCTGCKNIFCPGNIMKEDT